MRPAHVVTISTTIFGVAAGGVVAFIIGLATAPTYHQFWLGSFVIASVIAILSGAVALIQALADKEESQALERRRKMIPLIGMIISGIALVGFGSWYFWPSAHTEAPSLATDSSLPAQAQRLHGNLPGYSSYLICRIEPLDKLRRRYVFEADSKTSRAGVALYMSASNIFTLTVTDTSGETYPLEVGLGENGLPVGQSVFMLAEVGVGSSYSMLRLSIDGAEVGERKLPFPIKLGSRDFGLVVGKSKYRGFGSFKLAELEIYNSMLSEDEEKKQSEIFMKIKPVTDQLPAINFNGKNQSLATGAPTGNPKDLTAPAGHGPSVDFGQQR